MIGWGNLHRFLLALVVLSLVSSCASITPSNLDCAEDLYYFGSERSTLVDGHQVRYVDQGQGEEILLFVHPWAGNIGFWNEVAPAFVDDYRVVALDLPGHGKSDKADRPYDVELAARTVMALLDELEITEVTLVGNSLGGAVALVVVRDRPEMVSRLVLIDALGGGSVPGLFGFLLRQFATPELFVSVDDGLFAFFTETFVFDSSGPVSEQLVADMLALRQGAEGFAWATAIVRYLVAATEFDASPWLAEIQVPTLILWGNNDWILWSSSARNFAESIPNAELQFIDDCGHMPELERPEQVVSRLMEFLERTSRDAQQTVRWGKGENVYQPPGG